MPSFPRFIPTPENRSALVAVEQLVASLGASGRRSANLLYLHGPPGTGKTCLIEAAHAELSRLRRSVTVTVLSAAEAREDAEHGRSRLVRREGDPAWTQLGQDATAADLLVLEDVQKLPLWAAERLTSVLDTRDSHERATIVTASVGPEALARRGQRFPARLCSRLASGLVVALEPLSVPSREKLLREFAQRRQLGIARDILQWLAERLRGGARQLESAIAQLATLTKLARSPLTLRQVTAHFEPQLEAERPTVERIAAQVAGFFQVKPALLLSASRQRGVLRPRQVSMYLVRQHTSMSLEEIGRYFGGRDHTTVLHACRKVEEELGRDASLASAVRELEASLA